MMANANLYMMTTAAMFSRTHGQIQGFSAISNAIED
jgi:hypothetical protein